jgi:hypothetical protein
MRIYDIHDAQGRVAAFEIDGFFIGRRGVARIIDTIPGASIIRRPAGFLRFGDRDEFCEFTMHLQKFIAWEPWGDSSRYWIGPSPPGWCEELSLIREAFAAYRLWPWSRKRPARRSRDSG